VYVYVSEKGDRDPLTWSERLAAAIGAGRGIHHLHTGVVPPVFDNNLKITSILLGESMDAQVSDFGILGHLSSFAVNINTQEAKQAGVHFKEDLLTRFPTSLTPFLA
jgi:hypothetical protein